MRWPSLETLGLREWHFIQHGGVILKTAGGWFEWAPPSTDWRQPYWKQYPAFSRAVARICSIMSWGGYAADVDAIAALAASVTLPNSSQKPSPSSRVGGSKPSGTNGVAIWPTVHCPALGTRRA